MSNSCNPLAGVPPGPSVHGILQARTRSGLLFQSPKRAVATAAAKSLQSCPTPCDPIDGRLPHPWDSLDKNTGEGCHFLLKCMKVKSESEVAQSCPTLSEPVDCSLPGSSVPGIFQARALEWVPLSVLPVDCSPPGSSVPGIFQARVLEWVPLNVLSGNWKTRVMDSHCCQPSWQVRGCAGL